MHPPVRKLPHGRFTAGDLAARKGGTTVSVCLPARNEQATVAFVVDAIRRDLVERSPLVDEILVLDDHSTDATADTAAAAGARVVAASDVLAGYGEGHGKGEAMWKSLFAATGDIVAWCDADIVDFRSHFVVGLLGPLLTEPAVSFVKGCYERPDDHGDKGGRVTELVARPLLSLLFPQLASIEQPLAGEYAGRRHLLEQLPFVSGYGVDLGLLIDAAARCGIDGIVQVDLGQRRHRNRPLDELSPQAVAIMQVALRRAGSDLADGVARLVRVEREPLMVESAELPPLAGLPAVDVRP